MFISTLEAGMGILAFMARRFVAGEKVEDAMEAVRRLNGLSIVATVDHLGENVHTKEEATAAADAYLVLLDAIAESKVDSNVSIKLTMMGLEIDPEFAYANTRRIIEKAASHRNFVRIDMEGSPVTQTTLDLYRRFRSEFPNVGIVIQAYLLRSEEDIAALAAEKANVRLCKGAYKEPPEVAFPKKEEVNENYLKLAKRMLMSEAYLAVATHDRKMIEPLRAFIAEQKIPKSRYEWQMLYGIERGLQKSLAAEGERVRIYVPYGTDWLGYFKRRMMERKENFLFAFKHLFKG